MAYDLPTETETISEVLVWTNTVSQNTAANLFLLGFWVVLSTWLLVGTKELKALTASTGLTLIVAMLLQISGFVAVQLVMFFAVAFGIIALVAWVMD